MNQFTTVPRLFLETVRKHGQRTAMRRKQYGIWRDISWNEYYETVQKIACALISMGLKKGDKVAIIGDNCPEWVMIDLGIQCAGGVSTGIYATNAAVQCEYVLEHSESKFFFVENEEQLDKWLAVEDKLENLRRVIVWDLLGLRNFKHPKVMALQELLDTGAEIAQQQPDLMRARIDEVQPADLSMLIYTSGTTGRPKGAMLSHANVTWMSKAITEINPILPDDEVLSFLPLCHIFERLFSVLAHLRSAYIVNFIENLDTVTDNMREISPTVGYGVPRVWEKYYSAIMLRMAEATLFKKSVFALARKVGDSYAKKKCGGEKISVWLTAGFALADFAVFRKLRERLGFDKLRVAYSGAAPISRQVLLFFQSLGINLLEGYGQTEGSGVTTTTPIGTFRLGTVGQALPGLQIRIAEDGEILVKSPGVFQGYYRDENATAAALADGWLRTGDVGELDADGFLKIIDRKKDILITAGGKNIAPQAIENKLKASPYINDAVVIGDRRKYLTALIFVDEENAMKFARDRKLHVSTYEDLAANGEVNQLIQREVNAVNKTIARVEQVRKFTLIPKRLFEEDGEVTPTMKIKRKYINEKFKDLIEGMYS